VADFALPTEIEELRQAAARFADRQLGPAAREAEANGRWSDDVLAVLDGFSLRGLDVPEALGGTGVGSLAKVVVLEALAAGDAGGLPAADQPGMSAGALAACPDEALAAEVASACIGGDAQCPLVVVDPDAGGRVRLEWAPGWPALRWVWMSEGDSLSLLGVETDTEDTPALAFHASGAISATLDTSRTLGRWNLGTAAASRVRARARLWSAAVALGVAQAAFDATVAYTTERVVFGRAVAHHQGNAFELAAAATNVHGARLAVHDAARRFDEEDPHASYWATQAWITTIEAAVAITDVGIQLLGGHGFLVDHLAEKRFREVGMLRLLAGGRDAAEADLVAQAIEVPDPVFA
jgi:alkylation response protein AidB-like acyl-CoA dehydrogenase